MTVVLQLRRAGPAAAVVVGALLACSDSTGDGATGPFATHPSFAAGGSISVNLDQCATNVPRAGNCTWQNGDLNGSNSEYAEGLTVPFRLEVSGLAQGTTYVIHLNYDWTAGGHKAYDFLASVDATEQVDVCAPTGGSGGAIPLACNGGLPAPDEEDFVENNFPIPLVNGSLSVLGARTFAASAPGGGFVESDELKLALHGGTINSIGQPTHVDNKGNAVTASDLTGNTNADVVVTFTPSQSSVLFTWSGHLAQSLYWDQPDAPNGSGEVSGAPWHMRTQSLAVAGERPSGNKNQDRSIQPSALIHIPNLRLEKSSTITTSVTVPAQVNYTVKITNDGPGTATGVTISDNLPGNGTDWSEQSDPSGACSISGSAGSEVLSCGPVDLAEGASLTVTVVSATTAASCPSLSNTASASAALGVIAGSPTSPVVINVTCPATLSLTKRTSTSTVSAGDEVKYTITIGNAGPGAATNVSVTDDLPGAGTDWSIDTEAPANSCSISGALGSEKLTCTAATLAASASITVTVKSLTTAASCPSLSNSASATADGTTVSGSPTSAVQITVDCPDVRVIKTAVNETVNAGAAVGFTIEVKNLGPGIAKSVTLSDNLPGGLTWTEDSGDCAINSSTNVLSCSFGDLAVNATRTINLSATSSVAAGCTTLPNTATAAATNEPSNKLTNNSDDATITVTCPNLTIAKTPDKAGDTGYSVAAGQTATFTIKVKNTGTGAATNVVILDTLPAGIDWDETNGSCALSPITNAAGEATELLTCDIATLGIGVEFTVAVFGTVPLNFVQVPPAQGSGDRIQIDGNLVDDGAGVDWENAGIVCTTKGCKLDQPTGGTDDAFGQGTKEDTKVPSLVTGQIPNNKSDLLRFYLATRRPSVNGTPHDVLYLAWERVQAPNGTTNMDFELNQSSTPSGNNTTPVRTAGDVLITYDLSKGGDDLTIGFHRWVTEATAGGLSPAQKCEAANTFPCWDKFHELDAPAVEGEANAQTVDDPIAPLPVGATERTLDILTFGEAGIDLQLAEIFEEGACTAFASAYLKSRSSDSFTSEIKDFIAPLAEPVTNCKPVKIPNSAWASAANFAPGGTVGGKVSDTGEIEVTVPTASLFTTPTGRELAQAAFGPTRVAVMSSVAAAESIDTGRGAALGDVVVASQPTRRGRTHASGRHVAMMAVDTATRGRTRGFAGAPRPLGAATEVRARAG